MNCFRFTFCVCVLCFYYDQFVVLWLVILYLVYFLSVIVWLSLPVPCQCGLRGCKNMAHSISWPEVVKGVPNQRVACSVS